VAAEKTTVPIASDQRRPILSPSQPPPHDPSPKPISAAITAMPNVPRSTPNSPITIGATMPSSCASIPSAMSTSMQIAKVMIEKALIGWREIASLNDIATVALPNMFVRRDGMRAGNRKARILTAGGQPGGGASEHHDEPIEKIQ
jgi:hypothetical protein